MLFTLNLFYRFSKWKLKKLATNSWLHLTHRQEYHGQWLILPGLYFKYRGTLLIWTPKEHAIVSIYYPGVPMKLAHIKKCPRLMLYWHWDYKRHRRGVGRMTAAKSQQSESCVVGDKKCLMRLQYKGQTQENNVELQLYFATVFNIKLFEIFHYWNMVHCLQ